MDHSIRVIKRAGKSLSLSFDDGPDAEGTPAVLDILARYDVRATFFVVANRARLRTGLLKQILAAGHSIGNHSLDHSWRPFFGARETLLTWIKTSEQILSDLSGKATVGFRSPAGVQTPPLHWALAQLGMPLIHWNIRF